MTDDTPAITIAMATQADIDHMNAHTGVVTYDDGSSSSAGRVHEAMAIRFFGKVVAVLDEYGTATVLEGISQELMERLGETAMQVWPRRYLDSLVDPWTNEKGPPIRVCHRCGYNEPNHKALEARGAVSDPPYTDGCCGDFQPVPEHLRF